MAIIDEVLRLEGAANTIKAKTVSLGLDKDAEDGAGKVSASDTLDVHARAIDDIPARTPVNQKLDGSTTSVNLSSGYYGSNSTVNVDTMAAPSVSLSGTTQTISCKDKLMTDDIDIPAANVYRTGSDVPTSSTPGNDGDLYLALAEPEEDDAVFFLKIEQDEDGSDIYSAPDEALEDILFARFTEMRENDNQEE